MELSNRELATVILVALFFVVVLLTPSARRQVLPSIAAVLKVLVNAKILGLFVLYFAYAAAIVVAARTLGVWDLSLLKDTLIVVIFVGMPLLLNASEVRNGRLFLTKVIKETIGVAALIAFYLGLASLPLWGELIVQPILTLFVLTGFVASRKASTRQVATFCNVLSALIVVFLLAFTSVHMARQWSTYDFRHEGISLAMSIWLPLFLIPFVYVCAFVFQSETILVVLPFFNDKKPVPARVRLALVAGLHLRTRYSSAFVGSWRAQIAEAHTYKAARQVMGAFRKAAREEAEAENQRWAHLKEFAGVPGTDENGLRLDRREFGPTKKVLKDLYYMQMGTHRNRLGHYDKGLLEVFGDFRRDGLPASHGIELQVSKDKQSWRACRKTAGGWCFAVGGTRDLDSEWEFDGPIPPSSFPGLGHAEWANASRFSSSPEWAAHDSQTDR